MRQKSNKTYYFFIGTEAELIKLFPILKEFEKHKLPYKLIASGQNNISKSVLMGLLNQKTKPLVLFEGKITQTALGLLFWFLKTFIRSLGKLQSEFKNIDKKNTLIVVHGDTVSTVMGAMLGKWFGLKIAHVEAGLRSYNYLHPFPEEIDRVITSQFADIHLCPNEWAVNNIKNKRGVKVNTFQNTLLDSLNMVINTNIQSNLLDKLKKDQYFIFIMHRQENLFNDQLVELLIDNVIDQSKKMKCVFVMHAPTKLVLKKKELMKKLKANKNIILSERLSYIEFMKVLDRCEFIVTDGGSNQEESYYFGKPCLILRSATERIEGLNENVVLSKNNFTVINNFFINYKQYSRKAIKTKQRPSEMIANYLQMY